MTHLRRLRTAYVLKWVFSNFNENVFRSSKTPLWPSGSYYIVQNPRFYRTKKDKNSESDQNLDETSTIDTRKNRAARREAQGVLLEYLHSTRSLNFMDAENMTKNSPIFLETLLKEVENEENIRKSLTRFLRYHPINEYEPFFESMGLKPSEYASLLMRDLMFLNNDERLMENYHVLCNYGVARNKIGKIYKEATEVFSYDQGDLQLKLQSFEDLGLSRPTVIKVVACTPYLLTCNVNREFCKVLENLRSVGIEVDWIERHLLEGNSYNWGHMRELLSFFGNIGCNKEELGGIISHHPGVIFEGSGSTSFTLIGFLLKFGSSVNEIRTMFIQFPQIQVWKFAWNLRHCYHFLIELEMDVQEIGGIVCLNHVLLGSCSLKKVNSVLAGLNTGKKRACKVIMENPQILKSWVLGSRIDPLPDSKERLRSRMMKTKFLLSLGFVENSSEMRKALKDFRGKGVELQERFDCLVNAGLDRKNVSDMLKVAPQIINQSKEVIEKKIDFLVNDLGYPLSSVFSFPGYLAYTIPRVKLRFSMYNWLKDQGSVDPKLALSTVVACSENIFVKLYVNHHPRGNEIWEILKNGYSDQCSSTPL